MIDAKEEFTRLMEEREYCKKKRAERENETEDKEISISIHNALDLMNLIHKNKYEELLKLGIEPIAYDLVFDVAYQYLSHYIENVEKYKASL